MLASKTNPQIYTLPAANSAISCIVEITDIQGHSHSVRSVSQIGLIVNSEEWTR